MLILKKEEENFPPFEIVKNARLKLGISLEELSSKTKIQLKILKAIEEDNWSGLISYSSYKGFIKILSRELNFKTEPIYKYYNKNNLPESEKKFFLSPLTLPKFNYFFYFLFVILCILILHYFWVFYLKIFW